jgi:hypothetical protein
MKFHLFSVLWIQVIVTHKVTTRPKRNAIPFLEVMGIRAYRSPCTFPDASPARFPHWSPSRSIETSPPRSSRESPPNRRHQTLPTVRRRKHVPSLMTIEENDTLDAPLPDKNRSRHNSDDNRKKEPRLKKQKTIRRENLAKSLDSTALVPDVPEPEMIKQPTQSKLFSCLPFCRVSLQKRPDVHAKSPSLSDWIDFSFLLHSQTLLWAVHSVSFWLMCLVINLALQFIDLGALKKLSVWWSEEKCATICEVLAWNFHRLPSILSM